jgi:lipoprotein-anchoring transpeptidase ErfK/SrfK
MKRRHVGVVVLGAIALATCATCTGSPSGPAVWSAYPPQPPVVADPSVAPSSQPRTCERQTLIGTVSVKSVAARDAPAESAHEITSFAQTNEQGAHQVFDLLGQVTGRDGEVWYRALLPLRPNGRTGFIPARSLRLSQTLYRLEVDRLRLKLTLWNGCQIAGRYPIGLGTKDTPTPVGTFYLVALVKPPTDGSVYGTYAYGLSAYSDALTNWTGGGIIGLHGTNDPSSIGERKSHGCIRMQNRDIEHLVKILPLGTPIEIH